VRKHLSTLQAMIMAIVALFMLSTPALAGTKAWQISESTGAVSIESNGQVRDAARGMALKAGDAVSTGASGRAIIVRGGEYVIVSPKSRVRITKPEESGAITQIFQSIGSALFKIEKKETPHFGVKTPYLAAVVKGTTFNVTVTANGATVQVTEGRVEVATLDGGAADMIVPGRIGRVDANDLKLLKVLGNDATSVRSESTAVIAPANEKSATGADASDGEKDDNKSLSDSRSNSDDADSEADTGHSNSKSEFSGKIASPIASDPISLALVTGGLISGSQGALNRNDRANIPNGASAAASNGNAGGNAGEPADGNSNAGGNGNGNGDAGGNSDAAGGNGNGNGNAGGNSDAAGGNGNGNGNGNAGGNSDAAGGNGNGNGNAGGNSNAASGNGNGNAGGNSDAAGGNGNGNGNAGGNSDAAGGNGNGNGNAGGNSDADEGNDGYDRGDEAGDRDDDAGDGDDDDPQGNGPNGAGNKGGAKAGGKPPKD
jgi:FecR protein